MPKKKSLKSPFKKTSVSTWSYELRTRLNDIIGFSELIYTEKVGRLNKEQKEYLKDIIMSSKKLLQIVKSNKKLME